MLGNIKMVQIILPQALRTLADIHGDIILDVQTTPTQRAVLDALEARYPTLCGTIRDQATKQRRPFLRYFACSQDLSHQQPDAPLPDAVASGREPFVILAAIAGG